VVPLIAGWLEAHVEERFDLSSLRVVQNGGARLAPELRQRLRERFGVTPQEIYGTAEGLINMTRLDDDDERLLHSSGAPVCDADEIVVVDDDGREVPDGEAGELMTRGPSRSAATTMPQRRTPRPLRPPASIVWATLCASAVGTCTPKGVARTSSTAAAKRSRARRSRR
jgi:acyl-coenzyme A synthetase/AMP-(fatty) acid ligase